jgi:hypothetical protein
MNPSYQLLTSEAEYRRACDTVLGRAERELLIFDRDLRSLQLDDHITASTRSRTSSPAIACGESASCCMTRGPCIGRRRA